MERPQGLGCRIDQGLAVDLHLVLNIHSHIHTAVGSACHRIERTGPATWMLLVELHNLAEL